MESNFEDMYNFLRRCVHYDVSACGDVSTSQMGSSVQEEFSKELLREEEVTYLN